MSFRAVAQSLIGTVMAVTGPGPFIAMGHRYPYGLRGRATMADALFRRLSATQSQTPVYAELEHGLRMSVPRSREGASLVFAGCLMGPDERDVTALFRRYLRPGHVFFDVGSHLGFYSTSAAGLTAPDGQIHTFEAQEWLIPHLMKSAELNRLDGRAHINNVAVVANDGDVVDIFPARDSANTGSASLKSHQWVDTSAPGSVPGISLDAYVARAGIGRIDAMKIDVEGAEMGVIRGMKTILEKMPPPLMMIELMFGGTTSDAEDGHAVCRTLAQSGYSAYHIDRDGRMGRAFNPATATSGMIGNFGFAHEALKAGRPDMFGEE